MIIYIYIPNRPGSFSYYSVDYVLSKPHVFNTIKKWKYHVEKSYGVDTNNYLDF